MKDPAEARARFVHDGFVAAAPWYDRLTRVFSFGLDGWWRRACLARADLGSGLALLDVATGTGELALGARAALGPAGMVVGLDCCAAMLGEARRKRPAGPGTRWVQGLAETLPFRAASFDRVTVGFALRHFERGLAFREMARVLKPGGRLVILEWTRPPGRLARRLLLGYMGRVLPPLVGLVSRDRRVAELTRYLPQSIEGFVPGARLVDELRGAGLVPAGGREYLAGLVSIYVGLKSGRVAERRGPLEAPRAAVAELTLDGPRYKGWVILVGAGLLGVVAVQLLVALIGLLAG